MKEHILKYIELNPKFCYFTLCEMFGLSMEDLLKLMGINHYKLKDSYIQIYDNNGKKIYEEFSSGFWVKYEWDDGNIIKQSSSYD